MTNYVLKNQLSNIVEKKLPGKFITFDNENAEWIAVVIKQFSICKLFRSESIVEATKFLVGVKS